MRLGTLDGDPGIRPEVPDVRGLRRAVGADPRRRADALPGRAPGLVPARRGRAVAPFRAARVSRRSRSVRPARAVPPSRSSERPSRRRRRSHRPSPVRRRRRLARSHPSRPGDRPPPRPAPGSWVESGCTSPPSRRDGVRTPPACSVEPPRSRPSRDGGVARPGVGEPERPWALSPPRPRALPAGSGLLMRLRCDAQSRRPRCGAPGRAPRRAAPGARDVIRARRRARRRVPSAVLQLGDRSARQQARDGGHRGALARALRPGRRRRLPRRLPAGARRACRWRTARPSSSAEALRGERGGSGAQPRAGAVHQASHGAVAQAERSCGFLVAAALDRRHHDGLALHLRQRGHRLERVVCQQPRVDVVAPRERARSRGEGVDGLVHAQARAAVGVQRRVVDDPVEPGTRLADVAVLAQRDPGAREGLLQDVLGAVIGQPEPPAVARERERCRPISASKARSSPPPASSARRRSESVRSGRIEKRGLMACRQRTKGGGCASAALTDQEPRSRENIPGAGRILRAWGRRRARRHRRARASCALRSECLMTWGEARSCPRRRRRC